MKITPSHKGDEIVLQLKLNVMNVLNPLNKVMMVMRLLLLSLGLIVACSRSTTKSEPASSNSQIIALMEESNSLYAQIDSTFQINDRTFHVNVKQYDLTEVATRNGDTLSRPTYSCVLGIQDANRKEIFKDSLLRDSWGYKGKIVPIDYYVIAFPFISVQNNEIILSFNIYEETDGDAVEGRVAFDVTASKPRYFIQEATSQE